MTIDLTALSDDALILAACFLTSANHKLSFGGDGAEFKITERARAALKLNSSLINWEFQEGYADAPLGENNVRRP